MLCTANTRSYRFLLETGVGKRKQLKIQRNFKLYYNPSEGIKHIYGYKFIYSFIEFKKNLNLSKSIWSLWINATTSLLCRKGPSSMWITSTNTIRRLVDRWELHKYQSFLAIFERSLHCLDLVRFASHFINPECSHWYVQFSESFQPRKFTRPWKHLEHHT